MRSAVSFLGKAVALGALAVGTEVAFAYLWPAPRQPEFDPSFVTEGSTERPVLRLAAVGDSTLTAPGVDAADDIWIRHVTRQLAEATGRRVELRSFGVGGSASADVLSDQLSGAVEFSPHLVVVSVGANDVIRAVPMRRLEENLDEIVSPLAQSGAVVIMSGVGDLGTIPRLAPPLRQMASRLGRRADRVHERVAARHGAIKVNQWQGPSLQFRTRRDVWSPDRFHPNAAGHILWAETCWEVLEPLCVDLVDVRA